jgi:hypothetical protein
VPGIFDEVTMFRLLLSVLFLTAQIACVHASVKTSYQPPWRPEVTITPEMKWANIFSGIELSRTNGELSARVLVQPIECIGHHACGSVHYEYLSGERIGDRIRFTMPKNTASTFHEVWLVFGDMYAVRIEEPDTRITYSMVGYSPVSPTEWKEYGVEFDHRIHCEGDCYVRK